MGAKLGFLWIRANSSFTGPALSHTISRKDGRKEHRPLSRRQAMVDEPPGEREAERMSLSEHFTSEDLHPIDIVEHLAEHHDWDFDRVADDQIAMAVEGQWRTYSITLAWSPQDETWSLYPTDPATSDAERRSMGVPTLAEARALAAELDAQ